MNSPRPRFLDGPRPRILGHRGAKGHAPENTLPSFRKALELGADILEMDVHATRDGTVVVCHDDTVDRTTNGAGAVRRLMHSEIAKLDAGYHWSPDGEHFPFRGQGIRMPSLLEVVETFPGTPLNIEVKQAEPSIVDLVVRLLKEKGCEETVNLAAEKPEVMQAIRQSGWRGATGYSTGDALAFMEALTTGTLADYRAPGVALQVPERWNEVEVVTEAFVKGAHACGVEVHVWTVNELSDMARLLALGVDGFVTDYPERGRAAIAARGVR
ncbi:MAG: glycerophosphodiester phosphodiesterase [Deltaproteobacteria bacterium]|nr:glycerophosphodiester phosphodiesterase [Deltaproteobacteria bacterium]